MRAITDPTTACYVATRPVGDATVTIISNATGRSTIIKDLADVPEAARRREVQADDIGEVRLGHSIARLGIGAASILVDLTSRAPRPRPNGGRPATPPGPCPTRLPGPVPGVVVPIGAVLYSTSTGAPSKSNTSNQTRRRIGCSATQAA